MVCEQTARGRLRPAVYGLATRMTIGGTRGKEKHPGQVEGGTEAVACLGDCGSMSWVDTGARRHVRSGMVAAGPVRRPVLCDAQHAVVGAKWSFS